MSMVPRQPSLPILVNSDRKDADCRTHNIREGGSQIPSLHLAQLNNQVAGLEGVHLGDYEILGEYGRGGMGVVYKARHRGLDRVVALKVTLAGHAITPDESQRFQLEAAAVARLDHPNIVPVYEFGEVYDQQFFSMACMDGGSLAQVITTGPLAPRHAVELLLPIVEAVAYAHGQGVIHRDLKPENILLDTSGRPRLSDFGIAKFAGAESSLTRTGDIMGTPSYMPPEQAQGLSDQIGPLVDVYALGATLYCLLTGRPPFQAATGLETLKQVVEREPISPRHLNPAVDRDLETICLKCLEKRPDRRYASAQNLADDLGRFLNHQPIQARPVSVLQKGARWCGRNPLVAGLLVGVAATFLTAFLLLSWSYWETEQALKQEAFQRSIADHALKNSVRHEKAERWERYLANMTTVAFAFQLENTGVANRALEAAPTEHRNWEWKYFQQKLDGSIGRLTPGKSEIHQIAWLPGNRLIVVTDGIEVWDLVSKRLLRKFSDCLFQLTFPLALSHDQRLLAYISQHDKLVVWDLERDCPHQTISRLVSNEVRKLCFDSQGQDLIVDFSTQEVGVYNAHTGDRVQCWSYARPDGENLASAAGAVRIVINSALQNKKESVEVRDVKTGGNRVVLSGHSECVGGVAYNLAQNRIVTQENYPSNVMRLWDSNTGEHIEVLRGHTNQVRAVVLSPNGKRMASYSFDQSIRLWDGVTGKPIATLSGHHGRVHTAVFSHDGRRLVSASQDRTLRLWDVETGQQIALLCGHASDVFAVAFSPDGSRLASSAADGAVRLWDLHLAERTGVLQGHGSFVYDVAFHPDGQRVASASWDGTIRMWNATSGEELAQYRHGDKTLVTSVSIHPSGQTLATLGRDNLVRLWDLATGKEVHKFDVPNHFWRDTRTRFSPRGNLLASGSQGGDVYLWDVNQRQRLAIFQRHKDTVHDVAFSPDETWLASGGTETDKTISIWDLTTGELRTVLRGHDNAVYSLAVRHDGKILASGSTDGTVRLWDTDTWEQIGVLRHGSNVYGVAFHPDGTRLATACADNTIRLWDVDTRQEVAQLHGHGAYVHNLAFSPDGTRLVSASGDGHLRVWDALSAQIRAEMTNRGK